MHAKIAICYNCINILIQLHKYSAEIVNAVIHHGGEIFLYAKQDNQPLVHHEVTETVWVDNSDNINSEQAIVQQLQLKNVEESIKLYLLPIVVVKRLSMVPSKWSIKLQSSTRKNYNESKDESRDNDGSMGCMLISIQQQKGKNNTRK